MVIEVRPEPSEEEHAVIAAAFGRLLAAEERANDQRTEWWQAGVLEGVEEEEAT